jgi:hypothetical protein
MHLTAQQTVAIFGIAQSEGMTAAEKTAYDTAHPGAPANNDAVGVMGLANARTGNRGGAAGGYFRGMRNDTNGTCSVMEGCVVNGSDPGPAAPPDGTISASAPSTVAGFVATCTGRGGKGGDAFVVHSADGGTTRWRVAFHSTTLGATDNSIRVDSSEPVVALVNGTHGGLIDASGATFDGSRPVMKITSVKNLLDGNANLDLSVIPANLITNRILNYVANTDTIAGSVAASTLTDLCANQSFTVADASSVVIFHVRGHVQANPATLGSVAVTLLIDSAGTPQTFKLSGSTIAAGGYANALAGAGSVVVTGLAAGSHTVKVQIQAQMTTTVNCRANTQAAYEHLAIQAVEVRR